MKYALMTLDDVCHFDATCDIDAIAKVSKLFNPNNDWWELYDDEEEDNLILLAHYNNNGI